MGLASKEAWMSLFTEPVANKWTCETPELRKIAMIITAYHQELNRLKYIADGQLLQLQKEFKRIENYKKKISVESMSEQQYPSEGNIKFFDFNSDGIPQEYKENLDPDRTKTICIIDSKDMQSPDIFNVDSDTEDFNFLKKQEGGILESTSETPMSGSQSPKINKSAKQLIRGRIPKSRSPNTAKNTSQSLLDVPKDAKNFFSGYDDYQNYINDSSYPKITINKDLDGKKPYTMDNSVIDSTPDLNANLRRAKRLKYNNLSVHALTKNKQSNRTFKKTTLTQMFKDIYSTMEGDESIKLCEKNIKLTEKVKNDDEPNGSKNLETKGQINKDQYESFIENYMRLPFKKSPSPKHAYQMEPVRGKARQNLKGWSCQDCKKYYEALDLPEEELKEKMNKCSRHRSKFKPMNDTPPGYWDLTFPPTQPTI